MTRSPAKPPVSILRAAVLACFPDAASLQSVRSLRRLLPSDLQRWDLRTPLDSLVLDGYLVRIDHGVYVRTGVPYRGDTQD